jgi:integrase
MGHADISTTMNIYAEVTDSKKKESFANIANEIHLFWVCQVKCVN